MGSLDHPKQKTYHSLRGQRCQLFRATFPPSTLLWTVSPGAHFVGRALTDLCPQYLGAVECTPQKLFAGRTPLRPSSSLHRQMTWSSSTWKQINSQKSKTGSGIPFFCLFCLKRRIIWGPSLDGNDGDQVQGLGSCVKDMVQFLTWYRTDVSGESTVRNRRPDDLMNPSTNWSYPTAKLRWDDGIQMFTLVECWFRSSIWIPPSNLIVTNWAYPGTEICNHSRCLCSVLSPTSF